MTQAQVKKVLASLSKNALQALQKGEPYKIPSFLTIKLHCKQALPERERTIFGETRKVAARPASKSVKVVAVKKFKDQVK